VIQQKIGERIARIRKSKGLKQEQLADELGITTSTVSKIERGEIDASTTRLIEIAKALKVTPQEFFGEPEPSHEEKNKYGYATRDEMETLTRLVHALADKIDKLSETIGEKKEKKKPRRKKG
jgi:transcriptional regulator with XRE-family HTH domain